MLGPTKSNCYCQRQNRIKLGRNKGHLKEVTIGLCLEAICGNGHLSKVQPKAYDKPPLHHR